MVTGIASGNGTIVIELKDSEQTVIANVVIPVSVTIAEPEANVVWQTASNRTCPWYTDRYVGSNSNKTIFKIFDENLNEISPAQITNRSYEIKNNNTVINSGTFADDSLNNFYINGEAIYQALKNKTASYVNACYVNLSFTYKGNTYTSTGTYFTYYAN